MSTNNKKSVAAQALLDMDAITSAIKEESKKSLNTLLAEAVRDALREDCKSEDDDEDEKDYEKIEGEKDDAEDKEDNDSNESAKSDVDEDENEDMADNGGQTQPQMPVDGQEGAAKGAQEAPMANDAPDANAEGEAPAEGEGEEGWDDYSKYQVGDNTYDLTGEDDYDNVVKVYKLLKDDDEIAVVKNGNTIKLKDGENDTEYVIDLGSDDEDASAEAAESEEMAEPNANLSESAPAGFYDEEDTFDDDMDSDDDIENGSQPWDDDEDEDLDSKIDRLQSELDRLKGQMATASINENKARKPMKENKEVLFEVDLGYTDNYQDKDPIAGLSSNEPSKSGKSWHKGVPTGTSKPWAGDSKSKGDPFKSNVDEEEAPMEGEEPVEEATTVNMRGQRDKGTKKHIPSGRKEFGPKPKHHVSTEGNYEEVVAENKNLKKQVKQLTEAVIAIRKNLSEAYVTNANLGKITKLFLENTTSQAEKIDIVNRFSNEAKTVEQSKALYESINKELKKTAPKSLNINESSLNVNGSKVINEEKAYKSGDLMKTINLMNRVMGC
jgi:hypothetical protein